MKVIIVDDHKAMHMILRKQLLRIRDIEVVGMFNDTLSASQFVDSHVVHMAFVDINMPQENGLSLAKRIAEKQPRLQIVFVTSHKDYALEAFDMSAVDYITKPISFERIQRAVQKAMAIQQYNVIGKEELKESRLVSIYCLGGIEIRCGEGNKTVKWKTRKSAELFSYLLLHRDRVVPRTRIISDLFGGMIPKNADVYLNTTVYQMRKSLDAHGLKSLVESNKDSYCLKLSAAYIDMAEFEEAVSGYTIIDALNIDQAIKAEKLYGGELFGNRAFLWALNDIERLAKMYAAFAKKLSIALLKYKEEQSDVILILRKLLQYNELDEEVISLLLQTYTVQQDKVSLDRLFEWYKNVLLLELGIAPSSWLTGTYNHLRSECG